ncbi:hypothetical protein PHLGIDRAFT_465497 [Phlebiopsis gigantea 11061_1 CR5-6]|uniref:Uncharacterized protein n=1 Tax=Phlebiopsis gigantea (strain 11061_1 CR5-6) TaxID=745531 RepID=A0A0C3S6P7_PHLG1|nr:hypothetical protein PHLGIDRAFT_465497 [Phlebiopsis gigantea 11061_1 CR5-6]
MVATSINTFLKHRISHKLRSLARSYKSKEFVPAAKLRKQTTTTGAKMFCSLRNLSMRHMQKTVSRSPSLSTSIAMQDKSRKRTIRVSTLNFGPHQPDGSHITLGTSYASVDRSMQPNFPHTSTLHVVGLGLLDLPKDGAEDHGSTAQPSKSSEEGSQGQLSDGTFTEESVYSRGSWAESTQSGSRDGGARDLCSTESVLEGLEEELFRSEDWSLELEPPLSITFRSDALNLTSSSFDEESFARMAAEDLGW